MNVLVVAGRVPATPGMPGSPRLFSLCKGLSKRHRLTLAALDRNPDRYAAFLADPMVAGVFAEIVLLPAPPEPTWWGRQAHRTLRQPYFKTRVRTPRFHAEQCRRIHDVFSRGDFEVVYADGLSMSQYIAGAKLGAPAVIDIHDCLSLLHKRGSEFQPNRLRKIAVWAEAASIAREERSLSRTFRRIITNSDVDEAYIKLLDRRANTLTIGNGVDADYFKSVAAAADMSRLVFTGVMGYGPNEDAAVYFAQDILPLIHARHPEAEFFVVGNSPTDRVAALAQARGVHVTGGVPDMRPYLESAGIFVCPLRFGAGVKNKILAALAMSRPVVATTLSVEGLDLADGQDLLLADEPAQFASRVVQLMEDPVYARQLGNHGQTTVKSKYSWETSANLIETALRDAVGATRPAG
jgi:glycosyltransferase involved in cell wall biosynthesis